MRDVIRVVLVDPNEESRQALQQLLGSMGSVWIVEVLSSYQVAASRIVEIAPDLCLVALDSEPGQAVELIASMVQATAERRGAAGQRELRQHLDPQVHPRRST